MENIKLLEFARKTLELLENHIEWSSDTTSEIANAALECELAALDGEGFFKIKE
jgi:hypothetical protein